MNILHQFAQQFCKETVPKLNVGYQVRIHQKIKEGNKERIQVFEGMVIRVGAGHGVNKTFTVRKISNNIGVEKTFPLHSPNITKIEVSRAHKVRRSKLYFLRDLSGKALRLKEIPLLLSHETFVVPKKAEENSEVVTEASTEETNTAEKK